MKQVKCDYITYIMLFNLCLKKNLDTIAANQNVCEVLHIVVDKLNKLLVYLHITFMWSCTKLAKCDCLTQIKVFDFCIKIHSGADQNIR